jgi:hypothetical protein
MVIQVLRQILIVVGIDVVEKEADERPPVFWMKRL